MKSLLWTGVLLSIGVVVAGDVRTADACSGSCLTGAFVPGDGATVPANLPALVWSPTQGTIALDPSRVTLTRMDTGAVIGFAAESDPDSIVFRLIPSVPLVAGVTYRLVEDSGCPTAGPTATFTVGPDAPLPTALGTLGQGAGVRRIAELATSDGSCSAQVDVQGVDINLIHDASAAPWRDVLAFETRVDGQPWRPSHHTLARTAPGESWTGRGSDRVYELCAQLSQLTGHGLTEGTHDVTMRATLPGTTLALASDVISVSLTCGGPPPDDGGLICDGGYDPDAGVGGSGHGDGGGCSAGGGASSVGLGLGLAALLVRRRRARR